MKRKIYDGIKKPTMVRNKKDKNSIPKQLTPEEESKIARIKEIEVIKNRLLKESLSYNNSETFALNRYQSKILQIYKRG